MTDTYGAVGDEIATSILTGRGESMMMDYPLSERLIEGARLTVVHNHVAESMVRELAPSAPLVRIPMGVPLPHLTPQAEARRALHLAESDFVVASITHVNPMKRLDKVIRSFVNVVRSQPNARLIISGSIGAGVDLPRIVKLHNLDPYVDIWGYIDDTQARLLARAADVCVNLRHPTAGETSASLLRLLAAAKPVLVTDNIPDEDLPRGVGIRIPVDRFEVEMLSEVLIALARDRGFRESAGRSARQFIEKHHTMRHTIDGYREMIDEAFSLDMPAIDAIPNLFESAPDLHSALPSPWEKTITPSALDHRVGQGLSTLGLSEVADLNRVARAMTSIGLDHVWEPVTQPADRLDRLVSRLRCPNCGSPVQIESGSVSCTHCEAELGTVSAPDLRQRSTRE